MANDQLKGLATYLRYEALDFNKDGFDASKLEAWASALEALEAEPTPPAREALTDAEVANLCGEANRGLYIDPEHYFKAFRDAEAAHGIKE